MRRIAWILIAALTACDTGGADRAFAELKDASGRPAGTVQIEPEGDDVRVRVQTYGLPAGRHGIHIHEFGSCEPPALTSAGAHFNPGGLPHHGGEGNHHAGDLPNLTVSADGTGNLETTVKGITLKGRGHHSVFHKGGTSVVVHRDADDMTSAPSGNSGPRIACGVIEAVR